MIDLRKNKNFDSVVAEIQMTGKLNGKLAYVYKIMGRRSSFTSTSAPNDVGEGIGAAAIALFPVLTGAETIQVISSSANDDGAPVGTGARTIKLTYINTSFQLVQTADIILNGITAVSVMVGGCLQPLWFEVTSVGSLGAAAGIITLRTSAPLTLSQISAGGNESFDSIFMVPDGYTGYTSNRNMANINNSQDYRMRALVDKFTRFLSTVFHTQAIKNTPSNTGFADELPFLKFPARCKITGTTISSSIAAGTRADYCFTVIIVKN